MKLLGFERRWMTAIFDAIVPSGVSDDVSTGASDLPMERFVDEVMLYAPARQAFGFRAATWLVILFGPMLVGRLRTFVGLDRESRSDVLGRMSHSNLFLVRELPTLFKMLATLGYCGSPTVQRALGVERVDATPPTWMRP